MAQSRSTHKGARDQVLAPIAAVVYTDLEARAADHGTSLSQLSADLLAIATGYPALARDVHQAALLPAAPTPAPSGGRPTAARDDGSRPTKLRVPSQVYAVLRDCAARHSIAAGSAAADLLAIATGRTEAVRHLDREVLLLAI
ncbi:hypothetical protein [Mycobacterium intracellulare]|jgi:hypothetical protein|uniref:hypothetical protein n=1 Tax=Mycobacterium intracellulare TaxID=1767 RepID=UPI00044AF94E|nr:hypothetical protein [Mycobacterium intracellulare]ETZ36171.1 hypothetical protein L842_6291 [Mycobacterium intracellulare MIN_052511_1280]